MLEIMGLKRLKADASTPVERQKVMFTVVEQVLQASFSFAEKDALRSFFMDLQQAFIDWNDKPMGSPEFAKQKDILLQKLASAKA